MSDMDLYDNITLLDDDNFETKVSFGIACAILAFAMCGIISNFVSILIFSHPCMRSPINVLLTGLSAMDMCVSIFSIPTFVAPSVCVYWPHSPLLRWMTTYGTLYLYPLTNMVQTASVWTFVVITFERFVAVCRPFEARWSTTGRSVRALVGVCVSSILYNLIRFFEHKKYEEFPIIASLKNYTTEEDEDLGSPACNAIQQYIRGNDYYMSIYYSGLYLVTHFLLPFTILVMVNAKMIYTIRLAKLNRRQLTHTEKKEHRTATMMAAVIFMFLCCNTLPFVLNFVEQVDNEVFSRQSTKLAMYVLNDVSNLLVLLNASTTCFIYYACSQKYRQLFRHYLRNYSPPCSDGATVRQLSTSSSASMQSGLAKIAAQNRRQSRKCSSQTVCREVLECMRMRAGTNCGAPCGGLALKEAVWLRVDIEDSAAPPSTTVLIPQPKCNYCCRPGIAAQWRLPSHQLGSIVVL